MLLKKQLKRRTQRKFWKKLNKNKGSLKFSQQNQKSLDAKKYPFQPDIIVRPSTS